MYYFVSDVHLGAYRGQIDSQGYDRGAAIEDCFVEWLDKIAPTAHTIFLCGDIFDFWFEYNKVVPMGFTSVLAKFKSLSRSGIRLVYMVGNHDMWMGSYLTRECGVEIYYRPTHFDVAGKRVHVAHGDNLNINGKLKLKLMNAFFRSETARLLFKWLVHPDLAIAFGEWWSGCSRKKHVNLDDRGINMLVEYAKQRQEHISSDYYIYGHVHTPLAVDQDGYKVFFTSDWESEPQVVVIDKDGEAKLEKIDTI